jgi:hypothetical protein
MLWWGAFSPPPNSQAGGLPIVGCPRLLIQYTFSHPPHLDDLSSIHNPRKRRALVTGTHINNGIKDTEIWQTVTTRHICQSRLQSSWTHLITPSRNFVEGRWRSFFRSTSLGKRCTSYNVPPIFRKRAADRWSLRNFLPRSSLFIVGKAQKSHGARSELNSVFGLEKVDQWNPLRTFAIHSRSRPKRYLGFSNLEEGALRQDISKWSTVCSTFFTSGWSVVRSVSLAKGGASKKRPWPHLHKDQTRINEVSPGTFQTALVYIYLYVCVYSISIHLSTSTELIRTLLHTERHRVFNFLI